MAEKHSEREFFENLAKLKERRERGEIGGLGDAPSGASQMPGGEMSDGEAAAILRGEGKERDVVESLGQRAVQENTPVYGRVAQEAVTETKVSTEATDEQERIAARANIEHWRVEVVGLSVRQKEDFIATVKKVTAPGLFAGEVQKLLEQNPQDPALRELRDRLEDAEK